MPAPPLLESSYMTALRFLIGVFAERLRKTTDLVSIRAQTLLDKQRA